MSLFSFFNSSKRVASTLVLSTSALCAVLWTQRPANTLPEGDVSLPIAQKAPSKKFIDPHAPPKAHKTPEEEPGYSQQWFDMRKNEHNEILQGQRPLWYAHDRRTLAQYSSARNGNPIQSTTFMGPTNVGGRTRALLVDRTDGNHILAGGISGGLWRSTNGGTTWAPLNDAASSLAVSSITQSHSDPDVFYYGTGESRANSSGVSGDGIWKSTDGGNTFTQLSSTASNVHFNKIWKIEHGKQNSLSNVLYVGTDAGGLYRSLNGGASWVSVFNSAPQVNDIVTFSDGGVMIACYDHGIYYSSTGQSGTFNKITHPDLPDVNLRRIELENCAVFQNVVYALFENSSGTGLRTLVSTDNRGSTWTAKSIPYTGSTFQRYTMMLGVHRTNPARVIIGAAESRFRYSSDGGNTWASSGVLHNDHHVVIQNPQNTNEFYIGNDGGVYRSSWSNPSNIVDLNNGYHTTQFYAGGYTATGSRAVGGTQDNGTHRVGNLQSQVAGGDGGPAFINLQATDGTGYQSYQNGFVYRRSNMANGPGSEIEISTSTMKNEGVSFIHPYTINRNNGLHVFYPTSRGLWASTNGGSNFIKLAGNNTDISTFYAIDAAPANNPTIYYGGLNGHLYRITNAATATAGSGHTRMTLPASLSNRTISGLTALSNSELYVTFSNSAIMPHVWKVTNAHTANPIWTNISGNLPSTLPINRVEVNPANTNHLFAASDFGLYYSSNGGSTWLKHTLMPNVATFDVRFRASDEQLFVFTHGRGVWQCDAATQQPTTTTVEVRARTVGSFCCARLRVRAMSNDFYASGSANPILQNATISSVSSSWTTYSVTFNGIVPARHIRVYFDNDAKSRDVEVDWIRVNNITYQSESTAYAVGTLQPNRGCTEGFWGVDRLQCNGYFHYNVAPTIGPIYPDDPTTPPSELEAEAALFAPWTFPNPVQDRLYVSNQFGSVEGVDLAVYALDGQLITERRKVTLSEGSQHATSIEVDQLSSGVYILSITAEDGQRQVLKFTKL